MTLALEDEIILLRHAGYRVMTASQWHNRIQSIRIACGHAACLADLAAFMPTDCERRRNLVSDLFDGSEDGMFSGEYAIAGPRDISTITDASDFAVCDPEHVGDALVQLGVPAPESAREMLAIRAAMHESAPPSTNPSRRSGPGCDPFNWFDLAP
jgi:hypothetical protein